MRPLNNHGTTSYYSSSAPGTGTYLGAGAYSNTASIYSGAAAGVASSAGGQVPQGATSNTVRKLNLFTCTDLSTTMWTFIAYEQSTLGW